MPDLLLHGTLRTLDPARPLVEAALVRDGRFHTLGPLETCVQAARAGHDTLVLPEGSVGLPGLVDAHGHAALYGRSLVEVDLTGCASEAECVARVAARARTEPAGAWIRGQGWDQNLWQPQRFPTLEVLSASVPGHPVWLTRVDVHAAWVNARALSECGVDRATPEPPGGVILRDALGAPTGVLVDSAMELVRERMPPAVPDGLDALVLRSLVALRALGLTGIHDASCGPELLGAYERLARKDLLPMRVHAMVDGQRSDAELDALLAPWEERPELGLLTVRSVKLFADGALGSRGAKLFDPYEDDTGNTGLWVTGPDELRRRILRLMRKGWQPGVHCIGDRACFEVLKAFAQGAAEGHSSLRPRAEHLQLLRPEDVPLLARSGAVASMQPTHATSDGAWAEARLGNGTARQRGAYAWRQALEAGAVLALGSDFPIEPPDPRLGLWAAVGRVPRGMSAAWMPGERLSMHEALTGFTWGAAFAERAEGRRGRIAEGFDADLTVFAQDPSSLTADEVRAVALGPTMVAGRIG